MFSERNALAEVFGCVPPPGCNPRYNIAPTQLVLACRTGADGVRELAPFRWGLISSWAKDATIGAKTTNARAETVKDKPSFRSAFKVRRCLIPASGFYEWQAAKPRKVPHFIHPARGELFAFAGLWEKWDGSEGVVESCTIITTEANSVVRPVHDRMPSILPPEVFGQWLDPAADASLLLGLLGPCPAEWVALHSVGDRVGNVRNDDPTLIEPTGAAAAAG